MVLDADNAMTPVLSQNQCVVTRTSRLVSGLIEDGDGLHRAEFGANTRP